MRSATDALGLTQLTASGLAVLLVVMLMCPTAVADGDPASDVLLGQNVFYPYAPAVSNGLQRMLNAETSAAAHAGFHIKVALIGGPTDLGVVPQLFGKPQTYARFLDQELLLIGSRIPLLVVMPQGYGVAGMTSAATAAAAMLPTPTGKPNNSLARAAIVAVPKLAAAAGHPIGKSVDAAGPGSGGGGNVLTLVIVAVAAVALAGAVILTRRKLARR